MCRFIPSPFDHSEQPEEWWDRFDRKMESLWFRLDMTVWGGEDEDDDAN